MIMLMDTEKRMPQADWHPADVKAALEKRGLSLRALAQKYGYSHIQRVLTSHWWAAEQVVAHALGLPAASIWPSRYVGPQGRSRGQGMTRNAKVLRLPVAKRASSKPVRTPGRKAA